MQQRQRVSITKEQWDEAAAAYELGHLHAAEIAQNLGVSGATVSREFARRGCVKGCRVGEIIAELEARLDAEAEERARAKAAADATRKAAIARFYDEFVAIQDAADKAGEPWWEKPEIHRIDKELQLALR